MKVLHLTPHLGGGVGRALAGLVKQPNELVEHTFVCLEKSEKTQFINQIKNAGCKVIVVPLQAVLEKEIERSDIVQVEWWRHPLTIASLYKLSHLPMRLMIWCHVSGLFNEVFPKQLLDKAATVILTSACSLQASAVKGLSTQKLKVIHSSDSLKHWPQSKACNEDNALSVAYVGSLNFSKLHPDYIEFLAAVDLNEFQVSLIGDETNRDQLLEQARARGVPNLLDFHGYVEDVAEVMSHFNVLAYILNPTHYGTNENALLEAMAMGIVPVVLNNPAEQQIVQHGETGFIVDSVGDFNKTIVRLAEHPKERTKIGLQAAKFVKQLHEVGDIQSKFLCEYQRTVSEPKQTIDFQSIFGETPAQWFLSCQQRPSLFHDDGRVDHPDNPYAYYSMIEKTKGSVNHFQYYFSDDEKLSSWAKALAS